MAENILEAGPDSGKISGKHNDILTIPVKDHRRLAIGSIICGISCIGAYALINSVKGTKVFLAASLELNGCFWYHWLQTQEFGEAVNTFDIKYHHIMARERRELDPEKAQMYSDNARKFSIIAIGLCLGLIILIPVLMAFVSYLLTLKD